jgi:hypothetical protein
MQYFKNAFDLVFGYDETDPAQVELIQAAIAADWDDITGQWPASPNLENAKSFQIKLICQSINAALAAGLMTSLSIKMDTKLADIHQLKAGYDLAVLLGETTMSIVDYDNVVHTALPLADIETIMGEVGANYRTQFFKKQQYRAAIDAATTPEAVAAIVWS